MPAGAGQLPVYWTKGFRRGYAFHNGCVEGVFHPVFGRHEKECRQYQPSSKDYWYGALQFFKNGFILRINFMTKKKRVSCNYNNGWHEALTIGGKYRYELVSQEYDYIYVIDNRKEKRLYPKYWFDFVEKSEKVKRKAGK